MRLMLMKCPNSNLSTSWLLTSWGSCSGRGVWPPIPRGFADWTLLTNINVGTKLKVMKKSLSKLKFGKVPYFSKRWRTWGHFSIPRSGPCGTGPCPLEVQSRDTFEQLLIFRWSIFRYLDFQMIQPCYLKSGPGNIGRSGGFRSGKGILTCT